MFKFLKDKLKSTISKISDTIKAEGEEEIVDEEVVEKKEEIKEEEKKEEISEEVEKEPAEKPEEKKEKKKEKVVEEVEEKPEEKKEKVVEEVEEKAVEKKEEKKEKVVEEVEEKAVEKKEEIEEEPAEKKEEEKEEKEEKEESFFKRFVPFGKKKEKAEEKEEEKPETKEEPAVEEKKEEAKEEPEVKEEEAEEKPETKEEPAVEEKKEAEEKQGIISKIKKAVVTKKISEKQFEEMFWDLELALLENNVAVGVIEKIKADLKDILTGKPLARGRVEEEIISSLKSSIKEILESEPIDILAKIKEKKPFVICFVGINGSGKTTTIAKIANLLKKNGISCCLAAADTFRAAAIDQLAIHAEKLGVKIIKHDYGADPAAVAFDAIKHAEAKNLDAVLIDTAGRMHSNVNLQDEMKKIIRVANPDLKIFVGESITGNDCVEQAKQFNESIELDGIILSKADIDEKGGAAISISYVTKKPILYLGTGQEYNDLEEFKKDKIIASLGLC